jgi:hypothetical protein
MSISELLKPKSPEEIEDLYKRGFRKNSGKWNFCIDISKLISEYEESNDLLTFRKSLVNVLKERVPDIIIYAKERASIFEEIIKEFEKLGDNLSDDIMNDALSKLYDWADNNNVWIESLNDSENQTKDAIK